MGSENPEMQTPSPALSGMLAVASCRVKVQVQ